MSSITINFHLGIVGHGADKFTPATKALAISTIHSLISELQPTLIISGDSPLGGIDSYTEQIALERSIPFRAYPPLIHRWEGGYKQRNLLIAANSHMVASIVVQSYPPNYKGERFGLCYHCGDRNPPHVKSGGCYTAWKCRDRRIIIL